MSALDDINKKFNNNEMLTACEQAIGTLWEDASGYEWLAEEAATELAALEAVAEAANEQLTDLKNLLKDIEDYDSGKPIDWTSVRISLANFYESSLENIAALAKLEKARG